jgi:hypothetical protein
MHVYDCTFTENVLFGYYGDFAHGLNTSTTYQFTSKQKCMLVCSHVLNPQNGQEAYSPFSRLKSDIVDQVTEN